jgi:hypothetical protein
LDTAGSLSFIDAVLVVEAEKGDDRQHDGAEEDLRYVVIEDLLVGIGGVGIASVFPEDGFGRCDGIDFGWCGLIHGHGLLLPWSRHRYTCAVAFDFVGGVPLFPGARVFITKVPLLHNRDFHEIFKIRFQIGTG